MKGPHFEPVIKCFPLKELQTIKLSGISTIYIPPTHHLPVDELMLKALEINITELE